jgi:hypothetical protein
MMAHKHVAWLNGIHESDFMLDTTTKVPGSVPTISHYVLTSGHDVSSTAGEVKAQKVACIGH